jgi:hypothetical protein
MNEFHPIWDFESEIFECTVSDWKVRKAELLANPPTTTKSLTRNPASHFLGL